MNFGPQGRRGLSYEAHHINNYQITHIHIHIDEYGRLTMAEECLVWFSADLCVGGGTDKGPVVVRPCMIGDVRVISGLSGLLIGMSFSR